MGQRYKRKHDQTRTIKSKTLRFSFKIYTWIPW